MPNGEQDELVCGEAIGRGQVCHLSHTVSQGSGPWFVQRPASPLATALMVYYLHGEALSTAANFQVGFAVQLLTFLWVSPLKTSTEESPANYMQV